MTDEKKKTEKEAPEDHLKRALEKLSASQEMVKRLTRAIRWGTKSDLLSAADAAEEYLGEKVKAEEGK